MILNCTVNSNIVVKSLFDLSKLKRLMEELNLKIIKPKITQELSSD